MCDLRAREDRTPLPLVGDRAPRLLASVCGRDGTRLRKLLFLGALPGLAEFPENHTRTSPHTRKRGIWREADTWRSVSLV
jgi:hypothetical protein